ncbi:MAG: hypothetical protein U5R31_10310 [Acidimicrobiia bacterium]|nr:hypothetical protein [Acidimicrobiia bacterium]
MVAGARRGARRAGDRRGSPSAARRRSRRHPRRLLRERLPLYADAADIQVDAERPPEEIVDELVGVLW